jgi:hypothetical protein
MGLLPQSRIAKSAQALERDSAAVLSMLGIVSCHPALTGIDSCHSAEGERIDVDRKGDTATSIRLLQLRLRPAHYGPRAFSPTRGDNDLPPVPVAQARQRRRPMEFTSGEMGAEPFH